MANWENDNKIPSPGSPQYWSSVGLDEKKLENLKKVQKTIKFSSHLGMLWGLFFLIFLILICFSYPININHEIFDTAIVFIAIGACFLITSIIMNIIAIKSISKISNSLIAITILYQIQLFMILSTIVLFAYIGGFILWFISIALKKIINSYS